MDANREQLVAMADLPKLPDPLPRLHLLRWRELLEKHGFADGEHLKWRESRSRRSQAADDTARDPGREEGREVIDSIGITQTIFLAAVRFGQVVDDYMALWAGTSEPSEVFGQWLEQIQVSIILEVGGVWQESEPHKAWFEHVCRRHVEKELQSLVTIWKSRANRLEILHLENPRLARAPLLAMGKIEFDLAVVNKSLATIQSVVKAVNDRAVVKAANEQSVQPLKESNDEDSVSPEATPSTGGTVGISIEPPNTRALVPGLELIVPENETARKCGTSQLVAALKPGGNKDVKTRRRGFEPDVERHTSISEIVARHDGGWRNGSKAWRSSALLKEICADLDQAEIDVPRGWRTGKTRCLGGIKVPSWSDAINLGYKKLVVDQIQYSLDMASRSATRQTET